MKPFLIFSLRGQLIFVFVLLAKLVSLLKLERRHFHVEDVTAKEESSKYLFSQWWSNIFSGMTIFLCKDRALIMLLAARGLNFFIGIFRLPGSDPSGTSTLALLGGWSCSSSSEEGGTEDCTLPNGNSTSQVRGVVAKDWPLSTDSSSLLGMRRSKAAMSELRRGLDVFYFLFLFYFARAGTAQLKKECAYVYGCCLPLIRLMRAEELVERTFLVVSKLELKRVGTGPAVMGLWSISTPRRELTTVMPGHVSRLNAGLPLMIAAGEGRACSNS